jgi:hypothetical protein
MFHFFFLALGVFVYAFLPLLLVLAFLAWLRRPPAPRCRICGRRLRRGGCRRCGLRG